MTDILYTDLRKLIMDINQSNNRVTLDNSQEKPYEKI